MMGYTYRWAWSCDFYDWFYVMGTTHDGPCLAKLYGNTSEPSHVCPFMNAGIVVTIEIEEN